MLRVNIKMLLHQIRLQVLIWLMLMDQISDFFIPSVNRQNGAVTQSGIELSNGDGGSVFFKDSICPSSYEQAPYSYFESISMMDILPHGILVNNSSDVYVKGTGIGISFVFVTYQVG